MRNQHIIFYLLGMFSLTYISSCGDIDSGHYNGIQGPPSHSLSLQDSKEKGIFEFEVAPNKSIIILDSSYQLSIKSAWVENGWRKKVLKDGNQSIINVGGHYLRLIYEINKDSIQKGQNWYYFIGERRQILDGTLKNLYISSIDTMVFPIYKDTMQHLSRKDTIKAFDSLRFVRK